MPQPTLHDYLIMLEAGPLTDRQRELVIRAHRSYRAMERGDAPETLRELKALIASTFRIRKNGSEPNPNPRNSQDDHDAF